MDGELKLILIKFFIMVFLTILFVILLTVYLPPFLDYLLHGNSAYGQTATTLPIGGLRQVPQDYYTVVLPPAGVQQQNSFQGFGMENVMTAVSSFLASTGLSKYLDNKDKKEVIQKTDQIREVVRDNTQVTAKLADAQLQTNQQMYQNMEDKGQSITDKPAIKVAELQKLKDKAVETATKS